MLLAWWPIWGDPASTFLGMRNMLAWGPKDLYSVVCDQGGTNRESIMVGLGWVLGAQAQ